MIYRERFSSHNGVWLIQNSEKGYQATNIHTREKTQEYRTITRIKDAIIRATRNQKQIQKDQTTL